jgi:hypothetical protein
MSSSSSSDEPSSSSAHAPPSFSRSLSDITDEDLQLFVSQSVTAGAFSSWFIAVVIVYFDALEGQKVNPAQFHSRLSVVYRA